MLQVLDHIKVANNTDSRDAVADVAIREKKSKDVTSVGVLTPVNDRLNLWCERRIAVKRDVLTAVVDRFLRLDPAVQTAFIDAVDKGMEPHYAAMLRKIADELDKQPGPFGQKGTPPKPVPPAQEQAAIESAAKRR